MAEQTPDFETMPLEELRRLAMEESTKATAAPVKVTTDGTTRDEGGRFAKMQQDEFDNSADAADDSTDATDATDETQEDESTVQTFEFVREIDNGAGGKDRYTGVGATREAALEALADNIAEGKKNANQMIRDLNQKVKAQPKPERTFSDQEEFIYSQEMQTKPTEAFKKLFKDTTGYDITEFKGKLERVEAFEAGQRNLAVQQSFVTTHSDYIANPANGKLLQEEFEKLFPNATEFSADGLQKAYEGLKSKGLLAVKQKEADAATGTDTKGTERTGSSKVDVTQQRSQRKGSTISTRGRTAPVAKSEPTEDELYAMPMDKLRNLANAQLRGDK